MPKRSRIDSLSQIAIPIFTVLGYLLTSIKHPEWGLIASLISQPFWFHSSYKAYKEAGQVGILITSIILSLIILGGVINYWVF
jgi:hypothetical protein